MLHFRRTSELLRLLARGSCLPLHPALTPCHLPVRPLSASPALHRGNLKHQADLLSQRLEAPILNTYQSPNVVDKIASQKAAADESWWSSVAEEGSGVRLTHDRALTEEEASRLADVLAADSRVSHMRFLNIAGGKGLSDVALSYGTFLERSGRGNVATQRETAALSFRRWVAQRDGWREALDTDLIKATAEEAMRRTREELAPLRGTAVRLLCVLGRWRDAWTFTHEARETSELGDLELDQQRELASCLNAVIVGAAADGDWDSVWRCLEELEAAAVFNSIFLATKDRLLREAVDKSTSASQAVTVVGTLVNWYGRLGHQVLAEDADAFRLALRRALAIGDLRAKESHTKVNDGGVCGGCGSRLEASELSEQEEHELKEAVFKSVMAREEEWNWHFRGDFNQFQRLLAEAAEKGIVFDLVVDGLNLFYWSKQHFAKSKHVQGPRVLLDQRRAKTKEALDHIRSLGYSRVLFIARGHAVRSLADMLGEAAVEGWLSVFTTSHTVSDDPFFLMAALASPGAHLLTGDKLSQEISHLSTRHKHMLVRWWKRHLVRLVPYTPKGSRQITNAILPNHPHSVVPTARRLKDGSVAFHLPFSTDKWAMDSPLVTCPLCSTSVAESGLEAHLRLELDYVPFVCRVCRHAFPSEDAVHAHFRGPLARHPGREVSVAEFRDEAMDQRLLDLIRDAGATPAKPCACEQKLVRDYGSDRPVEGTYRDRRPRDKTGTHGRDYQDKRPAEPYPEQSYLEARPESPPKPASYADQYSAEQRDETLRGSPYTSQEPTPETKFQVKSELGESKAEVLSDGKVACMLCGARSVKRNMTQHVSDHHLSTARFHCGHCTQQAKQKASMQKHVAKAHGVAKDAEGAFTELDLRGEIQTAIEECLGSVQELPSQTKHCRSCRADVPATAVRSHIVAQHLKKPIHVCLLCDFASAQMRPGEVARHLRKEHRRELAPDTHRSDAEKYAHLVKKMAQQLFD